MTEEERQRIRAYARALAAQHAEEAPLTAEQRDRLRILLRPESAAQKRTAA
ncbi:hypothetical protein [Streptomyces sp. RPT161]|uniref:hypothetical protein n=1 Tax=Streptomyces sp. RPT161 TaxID=3015993 RepID=UPI0022B8B61E|nr:hypothetical protein [Streptomyces sp. RPT161]